MNCGNEFDNRLTDFLLVGLGILRDKGCPYDDAVAESTNRALKVEFVYPLINLIPNRN